MRERLSLKVVDLVFIALQRLNSDITLCIADLYRVGGGRTGPQIVIEPLIT